MPLIDAHDTAAGSADVVQDRFSHLKPNTEALEAGSAGSAKIVHSEPLDRALEVLLYGFAYARP